jgi:hypothetical protein
MSNIIYVDFKSKKQRQEDIFDLLNQSIIYREDKKQQPNTKESIEHGIEIFSKLLLKAETPELRAMTEQYVNSLHQELKQLKQG